MPVIVWIVNTETGDLRPMPSVRNVANRQIREPFRLKVSLGSGVWNFQFEIYPKNLPKSAVKLCVFSRKVNKFDCKIIEPFKCNFEILRLYTSHTSSARWVNGVGASGGTQEPYWKIVQKWRLPSAHIQS